MGLLHKKEEVHNAPNFNKMKKCKNSGMLSSGTSQDAKL